MGRGGFLELFAFPEGCEKMRNGKQERLGSQSCSIHPGIAGKCWPDKGKHLTDKESRKIRELQDASQKSAPAAPVFAFFCHIPPQFKSPAILSCCHKINIR
jgi:hypothetical protein